MNSNSRFPYRSEEHTSELQSLRHLVCRLLLAAAAAEISTLPLRAALPIYCDPPYSAVGGEQSVSRQAIDELKQQIPLLDYLEAHDWRPVRRLSRGRWRSERKST